MQGPFEDDSDIAAARLVVVIGPDSFPRLDKALAALVPEEASLSRSRLMKMIAAGEVLRGSAAITDPKTKVQPGEEYTLILAQPEDLDTVAQDIPLTVIYEDADLIVIDKPAGMVVHPAPGTPDGTLVNALLFHCGDTLSGIGGMRRPGIVHRIDKDTTGLLVVAKPTAPITPWPRNLKIIRSNGAIWPWCMACLRPMIRAFAVCAVSHSRRAVF